MKMIRFLAILCLIISSVALRAQQKIQVKVVNATSGQPLENVFILCNRKATTETNAKGIATVNCSGSVNVLRFILVGYDDLVKTLACTADTLVVALSEQQTQLKEITVVASTRNNQRIENAPLKVEVLGSEDMQEESSIKPSGIGSILGDISGVQVQQSSAVNGNANVRIQGLDGRYTQILRDGMPLFDGFSGGFGILSIPPLDLKQIELIKGTASTLYGGGAIGGLVNIISKTPTTRQEAVISVNQTTLKENNINVYASHRTTKWGYSFFGGTNYQQASDLNKDGFSDVADWKGLVIHPKLFFYPTDNTRISTGYTATIDEKDGGDMQVLAGKKDLVHTYFENNVIHRHSFDFELHHALTEQTSIDLKSSISRYSRRIATNSLDFKGRQLNYFSELSLLTTIGTHSIVAGINQTGDAFTKVNQTIPLADFTNNTVGAFMQDTWTIRANTTLEGGIRNDYHFSYGNFVLPRIALFHRFDDHWAARCGIGTGYKAPNPLAPQSTDYPIEKIMSLTQAIRAETSVGLNAEVNYKLSWNDDNQVFINHAFFYTQLNHPIVATLDKDENVYFSNENKPIVSKGFDTYIRSDINHWEIYVGYTFTVAERKYLASNQFVILTPKHRTALTCVRDFDKAGIRMGIEASYTGSQHREDYTATPGYLFAAAMIAKKIGNHITLVLNGENLFDCRQSNYESLYAGTVSNPTFHALWAPIDGRVINASLKWQL